MSRSLRVQETGDAMMLHSQADGCLDLDGAGISLPAGIRTAVIERARFSWVGPLPVRVMMDGQDDDFESDFDDDFDDDFYDDDIDDLDEAEVEVEVEEDDFDSLDDLDDDVDDFDDEV